MFGVDRRLENLNDLAVFTSLAQKLGGAMHIVRAEDHVNMTGLLGHEVFVLLRQAPCNSDLQVGSTRLFRFQIAEHGVELVVGVLANAARVEHDHIGVGDV